MFRQKASASLEKEAVEFVEQPTSSCPLCEFIVVKTCGGPESLSEHVRESKTKSFKNIVVVYFFLNKTCTCQEAP